MAWKLSSALLFATLLRFEAVEPHMGTLFRITVYAENRAAARKGFDAAFRRVHELDEILSDYNLQSELTQVCREAHSRPVKVSEDLFGVLEEAQHISEASGGAFDVTIGPVTRLWRAARRERRLPSRADLQAALRLTGYRHLKLDSAVRTVSLALSGMQVDLGGIAKGYAADEALRVLASAGIKRALVAASGDLAIGDPPPGAAGWRIAACGEVRVLRNTAVSTSGDSEQFVEIGGVRYSHIIDPRTGLGVTARRNVTVEGPRGMVADAWATALSAGAESSLLYPEYNHCLTP